MITKSIQVASLSLSGHLLAIVRFFEYHYLIFSLSILAVAFMSKGLYNVYFHELHRIPGPFFGSFTDFYKVYVFACRHIPSETLQLHQRFGCS